MDNIFNATPTDTNGVISLLGLLACGKEQKDRMEYFTELEQEITIEANTRKEKEENAKLTQ